MYSSWYIVKKLVYLQSENDAPILKCPLSSSLQKSRLHGKMSWDAICSILKEKNGDRLCVHVTKLSSRKCFYQTFNSWNVTFFFYELICPRNQHCRNFLLHEHFASWVTRGLCLQGNGLSLTLWSVYGQVTDFCHKIVQTWLSLHSINMPIINNVHLEKLVFQMICRAIICIS